MYYRPSIVPKFGINWKKRWLIRDTILHSGKFSFPFLCLSLSLFLCFSFSPSLFVSVCLSVCLRFCHHPLPNIFTLVEVE